MNNLEIGILNLVNEDTVFRTKHEITRRDTITKLSFLNVAVGRNYLATIIDAIKHLHEEASPENILSLSTLSENEKLALLTMLEIFPEKLRIIETEGKSFIQSTLGKNGLVELVSNNSSTHAVSDKSPFFRLPEFQEKINSGKYYFRKFEPAYSATQTEDIPNYLKEQELSLKDISFDELVNSQRKTFFLADPKFALENYTPLVPQVKLATEENSKPIAEYRYSSRTLCQSVIRIISLCLITSIVNPGEEPTDYDVENFIGTPKFLREDIEWRAILNDLLELATQENIDKLIYSGVILPDQANRVLQAICDWRVRILNNQNTKNKNKRSGKPSFKPEASFPFKAEFNPPTAMLPQIIMTEFIYTNQLPSYIPDGTALLQTELPARYRNLVEFIIKNLTNKTSNIIDNFNYEYDERADINDIIFGLSRAVNIEIQKQNQDKLRNFADSETYDFNIYELRQYIFVLTFLLSTRSQFNSIQQSMITIPAEWDRTNILVGLPEIEEPQNNYENIKVLALIIENELKNGKQIHPFKNARILRYSIYYNIPQDLVSIIIKMISGEDIDMVDIKKISHHTKLPVVDLNTFLNTLNGENQLPQEQEETANNTSHELDKIIEGEAIEPFTSFLKAEIKKLKQDPNNVMAILNIMWGKLALLKVQGKLTEPDWEIREIDPLKQVEGESLILNSKAMVTMSTPSTEVLKQVPAGENPQDFLKGLLDNYAEEVIRSSLRHKELYLNVLSRLLKQGSLDIAVFASTLMEEMEIKLTSSEMFFNSPLVFALPIWRDNEEAETIFTDLIGLPKEYLDRISGYVKAFALGLIFFSEKYRAEGIDGHDFITYAAIQVERLNDIELGEFMNSNARHERFGHGVLGFMFDGLVEINAVENIITEGMAGMAGRDKREIRQGGVPFNVFFSPENLENPNMPNKYHSAPRFFAAIANLLDDRITDIDLKEDRDNEILTQIHSTLLEIGFAYWNLPDTAEESKPSKQKYFDKGVRTKYLLDQLLIKLNLTEGQVEEAYLKLSILAGDST